MKTTSTRPVTQAVCLTEALLQLGGLTAAYIVTLVPFKWDR